MENAQVNFLEGDPERYRQPGQQFALVSFVGPYCKQKHEKCAMKIRGVFSTLEEAKARAKQLQEFDKIVDVYVVSTYEWLLCPPCPDDIQNQEHQDQMLNDIVKGHAEQQHLAAAEFENRKREMVQANKTEQAAKTEQATLEDKDPWLKNKEDEGSSN